MKFYRVVSTILHIKHFFLINISIIKILGERGRERVCGLRLNIKMFRTYFSLSFGLTYRYPFSKNFSINLSYIN